VYESQLITVQHTSGHVKVGTVHDHHARPRLLYISSAQTQLIFKHYFVVLFAFPVSTFGRVDRGSEVEVDAGAHVYPNGPKDVLGFKYGNLETMVEH
jgi:hypothetical protein